MALKEMLDQRLANLRAGKPMAQVWTYADGDFLPKVELLPNISRVLREYDINGHRQVYYETSERNLNLRIRLAVQARKAAILRASQLIRRIDNAEGAA